MKRYLFFAALIICSEVAVALSNNEQRADSTPIYHLQDIQITSTRASAKTPTAHTTITREQLSKANTGVDLPFLLTTSPSIVATSEAGSGVGYTGVRIRGSDASRINVTLNGIPMNDSESHMLFWVNTPDIAASTEDIQIQRGVGSSTNGAGAFGASINLRTEGINARPYAEVAGSYGSYNTHRESVNIGTGLLNGQWGVNVRLSNVGSDGYIDRASVDLKSYFLQAGYYGKNTVLKFITFAGEERTYHAWNGASKEQMRVKGRRYNSAGEIEQFRRNDGGELVLDENGAPIKEVVGFYKDQIDSYILSNYHLLFTQRFNSKLSLNVNLHLYKGDGYYEEYKNQQPFIEYNLKPFTPHRPELEPDIEDGKVVKSNLIRRKSMDNWFGGGVFSLDYKSAKLDASLGGALNKYDGEHFGQVQWVQNYVGDPDFQANHEYYRNRGEKIDLNIYAKVNWMVISGLYLYGDMQYRHINYKIEGVNDKWDYENGYRQPLNVQKRYHFLNPKAGIMYSINKQLSAYASFAVAHREPARNNFTDAEIKAEPKAEQLLDYELGVSYKNHFLSANVNLYYMSYKDQLILTGEINKIGEPITSNVPDSYRMGVELSLAVRFTNWLHWETNATFSRNRINKFTEFIDHYDSDYNTLPQLQNELNNTTIAYSPSVLFGSLLTATYKGWDLTLQSNYVSRQFLTNSASALRDGDKYGEYYSSDARRLREDMTLGSYFVNNLRVSYNFKLPHIRSITLAMAVNNIFNEKYSSNGGAGSYVVNSADTGEIGQSERYNYAWFFPQATTNFMISVALKF